MNDYSQRRKVINRRAFLYGAGTIAIGLPFLEGLPERSAWAATAQPIFTFFMCGACGVEPKRFWPASTGDLSTLLASGQAVDALADQAKNLLIVKGINYPLTGPTGCGHAQGLSQALTAKTPTGSGGQATASGPSVDFVISKAINATGTSPMTLYAGNLRNGYIADRLSFDDSARVRASVDNPYKLYQKLVGLAKPAGSGTDPGMGSAGAPSTPTPNPQAAELIAKRKSVNDTIRAELNSLMQNPKLSAADKQRLQQHFDAIRDTENTMNQMGTQMATIGCTLDGVDTSVYDALSSWKYNATNVPNGGIENIVELHMGSSRLPLPATTTARARCNGATAPITRFTKCLPTKRSAIGTSISSAIAPSPMARWARTPPQKPRTPRSTKCAWLRSPNRSSTSLTAVCRTIRS